MPPVRLPPVAPVSGPAPALPQSPSLPDLGKAADPAPGNSGGASTLARSKSAQTLLQRKLAVATAQRRYDPSSLDAWVESAATPDARAVHVQVAEKFRADQERGETQLRGLSHQALMLGSLPPIPPHYTGIDLSSSQAKSVDLQYVAARLEEIDIANTALQSCPFNGLVMPRLFRANLEGSHLMTGPADFSGAPNLQGISAQDTGFTRLNCQGLSKIGFCYLGGATQLGEVPNFEGCTSLRKPVLMLESPANKTPSNIDSFPPEIKIFLAADKVPDVIAHGRTPGSPMTRLIIQTPQGLFPLPERAAAEEPVMPSAV
jgi:uncharacterized protein YjbI with pentapeptide repeats